MGTIYGQPGLKDCLRRSLRRLKHERGLITQDIADMSGVDIHWLNNILSNKKSNSIKNPGLNNIDAVAKSMGMTIDELVHYDDNPEEHKAELLGRLNALSKEVEAIKKELEKRES